MNLSAKSGFTVRCTTGIWGKKAVGRQRDADKRNAEVDLEKVNADAEEMLSRLETEMAKDEGVTEALKRQSQMVWVIHY